jgi:hypothetical protein
MDNPLTASLHNQSLPPELPSLVASPPGYPAWTALVGGGGAVIVNQSATVASRCVEDCDLDRRDKISSYQLPAWSSDLPGRLTSRVTDQDATKSKPTIQYEESARLVQFVEGGSLLFVATSGFDALCAAGDRES